MILTIVQMELRREAAGFDGTVLPTLQELQH
jgi:hypothetical protein